MEPAKPDASAIVNQKSNYLKKYHENTEFMIEKLKEQQRLLGLIFETPDCANDNASELAMIRNIINLIQEKIDLVSQKAELDSQMEKEKRSSLTGHTSAVSEHGFLGKRVKTLDDRESVTSRAFSSSTRTGRDRLKPSNSSNLIKTAPVVKQQTGPNISNQPLSSSRDRSNDNSESVELDRDSSEIHQRSLFEKSNELGLGFICPLTTELEIKSEGMTALFDSSKKDLDHSQPATAATEGDLESARRSRQRMTLSNSLNRRVGASSCSTTASRPGVMRNSLGSESQTKPGGAFSSVFLDGGSQEKPLELRECIMQFKQEYESRESKDMKKNTKTYTKCKYRMYNVEEKQYILQLAERYGEKNVAKELQIPVKKLIDWRTNGPRRKKGAGRKTKSPVLEKILIKWVVEKILEFDGRLPPSQTCIEEAVRLSRNLNIEDSFKASKGWYTKFKMRHDAQIKSAIQIAEQKNYTRAEDVVREICPPNELSMDSYRTRDKNNEDNSEQPDQALGSEDEDDSEDEDENDNNSENQENTHSTEEGKVLPKDSEERGPCADDMFESLPQFFSSSHLRRESEPLFRKSEESKLDGNPEDYWSEERSHTAILTDIFADSFSIASAKQSLRNR